jgi:multiple sugar transport system substrate-binding protein
MFPAGKLVATSGGSWGYIYDWGAQSKNPIPDVTHVVGTWEIQPNREGITSLVSDKTWIAHWSE